MRYQYINTPASPVHAHDVPMSAEQPLHDCGDGQREGGVVPPKEVQPGIISFFFDKVSLSVREFHQKKIAVGVMSRITCFLWPR